MLDDDDFNADFDRKTPWQRFGLPAGAVVAALVVGASAYYLLKGGAGPAARPHAEQHITQVQLPPPPPPPPPPKTPPPPKPQETPKLREAAPTTTAAKQAPKAPSPKASVTTSIAGPGNSGLAVGNDGGGIGLGTGTGTGDGAGDNDGYVSSKTQARINEALHRSKKLEYLHYRATLTFTLNADGRFTNVAVSSFSGDEDARDEVMRVVASELFGEAPPASTIGKQITIRTTGRARG